MVHEWSFVSAREAADPFNELELDVIFTARMDMPCGCPPSGPGRICVSFLIPVTGRFTYRSVCSDPTDGGLHGRRASSR